MPTNTSNEIVIKGVLKRIDSENKKMYFLDVNTGTDYEVPYTGGTDIKTKYDTIIAAVNLEIGSIYDVTCDKKEQQIRYTEQKMRGSVQTCPALR